MRHTKTDLVQMQSLPLEDKILLSKQRIKAWYEHYDGMVYVSFSGGKDSTVLKHLVDSIYDDVPSVFCNTGLEYPEVRSFALKQPNTIRIDPKIKFYDVIERYGYPIISKEQSQFIHEVRHTSSDKLRAIRLNPNGGSGAINTKWRYLIDAPFKISHMCCDVMKKRPFKAYEKETGRHPYVGTLAEESTIRTQHWLKYGCNAFQKTRPTSTPLAFWTEQDIYQYILWNRLEIAPVYGDIIKYFGRYKTTGVQRTGCMFCCFGVHSEYEPNRFQKMKHTHPKQYQYCMETLGLHDVLEYLNVNH